MAEQEGSDSYVVFTMIFCDANFLFGEVWNSNSRVIFKLLLYVPETDSRLMQSQITKLSTSFAAEARNGSWEKL